MQLPNIKLKLVQAFERIINALSNLVEKFKNSQHKANMMQLLLKAKKGLANSKTLNTYDEERVYHLNKDISYLEHQLEVVKAHVATESFIMFCDDMQIGMG